MLTPSSHFLTQSQDLEHQRRRPPAARTHVPTGNEDESQTKSSTGASTKPNLCKGGRGEPTNLRQPDLQRTYRKEEAGRTKLTTISFTKSDFHGTEPLKLHYGLLRAVLKQCSKQADRETEQSKHARHARGGTHVPRHVLGDHTQRHRDHTPGQARRELAEAEFDLQSECQYPFIQDDRQTRTETIVRAPALADCCPNN